MTQPINLRAQRKRRDKGNKHKLKYKEEEI